MLVLEGVGFAEKVHQAFGAEFKDAVPGMPQQLVVEFFRYSRPTNAEGFILKRDDICHFILPCFPEVLMEFVSGPADKLSIRAEFFDRSQRTVLEGEEVHSTLKMFVEQEMKKGRRAQGHIGISVKVSATKVDDYIREGQVNTHGFSFAQGLRPEPSPQWPILAALGVVERKGEFSLGCMIRNMIDRPFDGLFVEFAAMTTDDKTKWESTYLKSEQSGPLNPGEQRPFILPFEHTQRVRELVKSLAAGRYVLVMHDKKFIYNSVASPPIKNAFEYMDLLMKEASDRQKQPAAPEGEAHQS